MDVDDKPRVGIPMSGQTEEKIKIVSTILEEDKTNRKRNCRKGAHAHWHFIPFIDSDPWFGA